MVVLHKREDYINSPSPIEPELREFFNVDEPLVIFDIGSCEGEDSIRYSRIFPNARIFAFEPLPSNVELLGDHLKKFGVNNVTVIPLALSDKKGVSPFYLSSGCPEEYENSEYWNYGNKSSSLFPPTAKSKEVLPWLEFNTRVNIQTETLANIWQQYQLKQIDFVHMDVQGAELKVLKGAKKYLKNIRLIWLEVEAEELYKKQPLKPDIEQFMFKNKFQKLKDTVDQVSGDQLYVNLRYLNPEAYAEEESFLATVFKKLGFPLSR